MKYYPLLTLLLFSFIVGCSNSAIENTDDRESGNWLGWWGRLGEFYIVDRTENIGTYQTGPLTINIEAAQLVKGNFLKSENELSPEEHYFINLIGTYNLDINEEQSNEIAFNNSFLGVETDQGEHATVSENPSSVMESFTILDNELPYSTAFELEETAIEEVNRFTLFIQSPMDSNEEPLDDDLEIEINF